MAASQHYQYWSSKVYEIGYREFVKANAEKLEGDTRDCADLSLSLLIEFAAIHGLPVTFYDNAGMRYISKGGRQSPSGGLLGKTWKDKESYMKGVLSRIGAKSLFNQNMEPNPRGPEPGDLMIKEDHAALVFRVLPTVTPHPYATKYGVPGGIPLFPGPAKAALELNQTRYFRDVPVASYPWPHFDYLTHRGDGKPKKQKAELIFFADVQDMLREGFQFRRY